MASFTHVVPIGANCRLTLNVRRHFGHGESYPFDWWITPLPGLITTLRSDFDPDLIYDPAALRRVPNANGGQSYVENAALGLRFVHEFPGLPENIEAPVDWPLHCAGPRGRLTHLAGKWRSLDAPGNRLLFVRFCVSPRGDVPCDSQEDLDLLETLLSERFEHATVTLLPISGPGRVGARPTVCVRDPSSDWKGDAALWSAALAGTGHTLDNPALKPFDWGSIAEDTQPAPAPTLLPARPIRSRPGRLVAALKRRFRARAG